MVGELDVLNDTDKRKLKFSSGDRRMEVIEDEMPEIVS